MTAADQEYMRMKATELRDNFKKGRILYDEYISQVKRLAEYYKVDYRELVDRKTLGEGEEELPWVKDNASRDANVNGNAKKGEEKRNTLNSNNNSSLNNPSKNYQIVEN